MIDRGVYESAIQSSIQRSSFNRQIKELIETTARKKEADAHRLLEVAFAHSSDDARKAAIDSVAPGFRPRKLSAKRAKRGNHVTEVARANLMAVAAAMIS